VEIVELKILSGGRPSILQSANLQISNFKFQKFHSFEKNGRMGFPGPGVDDVAPGNKEIQKRVPILTCLMDLSENF
jgi:hypothetical protein